jgi:leucyl-tRNA synthetase
MLRITAYADRLLEDLDIVDWPEPIKIMQRNWIGKSTGAEVDFPLASIANDQWLADRVESGFPAEPEEDVLRVYTTRPDTLFGATYMVLAPEHPLVAKITTDAQRADVEAYVEKAVNKSELERTAEAREKTGVFTGAFAVNPVNREQIPIWVADYVMMSYGTGAIMAVPAHDTRDLEFARTFDLPVVQVVEPPSGEDWQGFTGQGKAVNSGDYSGMETAEFKKKITADLSEAGLGRAAVNYKLRDWLFSRQRYWGEPFPIVHCDDCGAVGVAEDDLPVALPEMEDFTPAAGEDPDAPPQPPLGKAGDWAEVDCPRCGKSAYRELNTMPQWAGSCWYYLRFLDPRNNKRFCSPEAQLYWMGGRDDLPPGVDLYVGGAEHAVLHLLYARFWHKVLYDLGHVSVPEPFRKLFNQGMIRSFAYRDKRGVYLPYDKVDTSGDKPVHVETGEEVTESVEKMSKSLKNVVNPDEVIAQYGADTFRLYEMFMGPLEASKPWNTTDVPGVHRFLQRVWRMLAGTEDQAALLAEGKDDDELERSLHKLIRKVGEDIEAMKFNTAIAAMMEFVNHVFKAGRINHSQAQRFLLVLAPFAPHIAEELWQKLGQAESLAWEPWPKYDESLTVDESVELPVQVNGKVRGRIQVAADADQDTILAAAKAEPNVAGQIEGKSIVKEIVVPGRLVNLVAK